ncbi:MAG: TetR/AcrR family transcriptional regulator [Acidimicrobiales bacterium]
MEKRSYVQTQRAEGAEEKRRHILRAARELLLTRTLPEVTLDAVAKEARAARSTVYLAFGSRSGLFEALAEQLLVDIGFDRLVAAVEHPDPVHAMRSSLVEAARLYASDHQVAGARWAGGALEPEAAGAIRVLEHGRWEGMVHLARRLHDAGHLRSDTPVKEAAEALWVLTSFDAFDQLFTGRRMKPKVIAERLTSMAERAILAVRR